MKNREEEQNQVAFVSWFRYQYPAYRELLTFASFGENIGPKRMARLKQMGLTPGYPDLFLAVPKRIEHHKFKRRLGVGMEEFIEFEFFGGLFIEMKSKKGKPTPHQLHIHNILRERHYIVKIAHTWEEAKEIVIDYFGDALLLQ
jgi:hypothetical protein